MPVKRKHSSVHLRNTTTEGLLWPSAADTQALNNPLPAPLYTTPVPCNVTKEEAGAQN